MCGGLSAVVFAGVCLVAEFAQVDHVFLAGLEVGVEFGVYEGVVFSVVGPRAAGDAGEVDEAPVDGAPVWHAEVVAHGG